MYVRNLKHRVDRLEGMQPDTGQARVFLWFQGQSLARALELAELTLDDKPLLPIRIVGVKPGEQEPRPDPIYERDRHLLD